MVNRAKQIGKAKEAQAKKIGANIAKRFKGLGHSRKLHTAVLMGTYLLGDYLQDGVVDGSLLMTVFAHLPL